MSNENILEVKNLMVFYENALAINNVSIRCKKGAITGVFGSNSAGKTTLMTTISGVIEYFQKQEKMRGGERITWHGEIIYKNENIINLKANLRAKKGIILCPERRRLFVESSVIENLKIGGFLTSKEKAKETLDYIFNLFPELIKLKNKPAGFLSGGEQQMLAIGRALMAQPELLILDEPLLGLAPAIEKRLAKAIKEINDELKVTILIAEQYVKPLLPVIDYCFVLENGGLIFEGTKEEFMNNPDVMEAYFGNI